MRRREERRSQRVDVSPGPEQALGHGQCVDVVFDDDWNAEASLQLRADLKIVPCESRGEHTAATGRIHHSRHTQPHPQGACRGRRPVTGEHHLEHVEEPFGAGVDPFREPAPGQIRPDRS